MPPVQYCRRDSNDGNTLKLIAIDLSIAVVEYNAAGSPSKWYECLRTLSGAPVQYKSARKLWIFLGRFPSPHARAHACRERERENRSSSRGAAGPVARPSPLAASPRETVGFPGQRGASVRTRSDAVPDASVNRPSGCARGERRRRRSGKIISRGLFHMRRPRSRAALGRQAAHQPGQVGQSTRGPRETQQNFGLARVIFLGRRAGRSPSPDLLARFARTMPSVACRRAALSARRCARRCLFGDGCGFIPTDSKPSPALLFPRWITRREEERSMFNARPGRSERVAWSRTRSSV